MVTDGLHINIGTVIGKRAGRRRRHVVDVVMPSIRRNRTQGLVPDLQLTSALDDW